MYLNTLVTSVEDARIFAFSANIKVQDTLTNTKLIASLIYRPLSTVSIATRTDTMGHWIDTRAIHPLYFRGKATAAAFDVA